MLGYTVGKQSEEQEQEDQPLIGCVALRWRSLSNEAPLPAPRSNEEEARENVWCTGHSSWANSQRV